MTTSRRSRSDHLGATTCLQWRIRRIVSRSSGCGVETGVSDVAAVTRGAPGVRKRCDEGRLRHPERDEGRLRHAQSTVDDWNAFVARSTSILTTENGLIDTFSQVNHRSSTQSYSNFGLGEGVAPLG